MRDRLFDLRRWLEKVGNMSLEARTYDYYQEQARLDRLYYRDDLKYWFLHFTRLRDINLPSRATTETEAEPMILEDDEYIGEDVSALYDDNLYVLMLQRNRHSLSPTGIETYLNLLWEKENKETIYLRPITLKDSIERAKKANYYRKMTVRFADLRNKVFREGKSPIRALINCFGKYNPINAEITINLGYVKGETLHRQTVHDTIDDILDNKDIVTKAELGKKDTDDTKVEVIDLFEDKMHDFTYIPLEKKRSLTHEDVAFRMYEIYRDKKEEIESQVLQERIDGNEI